MAGRHLLDQCPFGDVNSGGFLLAAIDNGGNSAIAAQCTGGSLASPFARLSRKDQSIAHVTNLSSVLFQYSARHASRVTIAPEERALAGKRQKASEMLKAAA